MLHFVVFMHACIVVLCSFMPLAVSSFTDWPADHMTLVSTSCLLFLMNCFCSFYLGSSCSY